MRPRSWGRVHMMRSGKRSWNPELSNDDLGEEDMEDYDNILVSEDPHQFEVSKRGDNGKAGDHFIFRYKLKERVMTNK